MIKAVIFDMDGLIVDTEIIELQAIEKMLLSYVEPKFCLALEDTESGVQSAHAAGMKVIAIPNSYSKAHDFSKANNVVNSLKSVTMELINSL